MQRNFLLPSTLSLFVATATATDYRSTKLERYFYTGTIGDKYSIQMELKHNSEDGNWTGNYSYIKKDNFLKTIELEGKVNDLNLKLSEFIEKDDRKTITGHFKGTFDDLNMNTAKGEWSSVNGKTNLTFTLVQVAQHHQRDKKRTFEYSYKTEDEYCPCHNPITDKNNHCICEATATVTYPVFNSFASESLTSILENKGQLDVNIKVDKELTEGNTQYPEQGELTTDITVAFYSSPLISLKIFSFMYNWGAAHPNAAYDSINMQVDGNNKANELKLQDIVTVNKKCIKKLNNAIAADLRRQQASSVLDDTFDSSNLYSRPFLIQPGGLLFLFSPYEIGSYAEGSFEAEITWNKIQECIPETSLLIKIIPEAS